MAVIRCASHVRVRAKTAQHGLDGLPQPSDGRDRARQPDFPGRAERGGQEQPGGRVLVHRRGDGSALADSLRSPRRVPSRGVAGRALAATHEGLGVVVELRDISVLGKLQATYGFALRPHSDDGFQVHREVCKVTQEDGSVSGFSRRETSFSSNPAVDIREPVEEHGELVLKPSVEHDALALPLVAGHYPFREVHDFLSGMRVYKIDPHVLQGPQSPDEGRRLLANGSNAASVLKRLGRHFPEELPNVRDLLAAIVPSMKDVSPTMHGNKLSLEFTQQLNADVVAFDAADMSDGTLRALGLITAVYQRPTPPIVVIEEPELTMHPGALGAILDLLQHASERMQVVVTTHSPDILDARWIEDRHLRLLEWEDGKTKVSRISEATRDILADGVMCAGELLRSNALRAEDRSS